MQGNGHVHHTSFPLKNFFEVAGEDTGKAVETRARTHSQDDNTGDDYPPTVENPNLRHEVSSHYRLGVIIIVLSCNNVLLTEQQPSVLKVQTDYLR